MVKSNVMEPRSPASRPYDDIGLFFGRRPQRHSMANARIISADSHIGLGGGDIFYDDAPTKLKDRVPRVYFNDEKGYWTASFKGNPVYPFGSELFVHSVEGRDGVWNIETRLADMDAEGIDAEVVFPQVLPLTLFKLGDIEAREYIMNRYNRYLADAQLKAPGRFYGAGVPNYWDPAKGYESVRAMHEQGLKIALLPCSPGQYEDGQQIRYEDSELRPMWEAIQAFDLTTSFHIGESAGFKGKSGFPAGVLNQLLGPDFRQIWGQLVFGGVLDDFPALRVVFAEANIHWVPGMLQDADMLPESFPGLIEYVPRMRPSDYWYRNCYATFMHDPAGLRLLDKVGIKNALWAVDYPHNEGTFGYTGSAIDAIVELIGEETARCVLGQNASDCFKI